MKKAAILVGLIIMWAAPALAFDGITFQDPAGDDKGPGTYVYPSNSAYEKGSFDLRKVKISDKGDKVEFKVTLKARISDPWDSKNWSPPGQGFSLQFIQIYVDTDHKAGSGFDRGLPGVNVRFADESRWDKVVLISPQPVSRLKMEAKVKAKDMKKAMVFPKKVRVKGKTLIVTVPKSKLGDPAAGWGWQVVVQSNEGYPDATDFLTRDVNEVAGDHRFGGGTDFDCDPHALDILAGEANGDESEADAQYKALKYECAGSDVSKAKQAILPMIYK